MKNILFAVLMLSTLLFSIKSNAECRYNIQNEFACDTDAEFKEFYKINSTNHCKKLLRSDPRIPNVVNINSACECQVLGFLNSFSIDELKNMKLGPEHPTVANITAYCIKNNMK